MGRERLPSFLSSHRPPRASCFSITAIFIGIPSGLAGASAEERAVREKVNKQHGRSQELVPLTDP